MIGVVAKLIVKDGKQEDFAELAKDLMAKVKANEPGCLTYQLYKSRKEANAYIFMEQYASQADLEVHGQSDYFKVAIASLSACLAATPDVQYYDIVE